MAPLHSFAKTKADPLQQTKGPPCPQPIHQDCREESRYYIKLKIVLSLHNLFVSSQPLQAPQEVFSWDQNREKCQTSRASQGQGRRPTAQRGQETRGTEVWFEPRDHPHWGEEGQVGDHRQRRGPHWARALDAPALQKARGALLLRQEWVFLPWGCSELRFFNLKQIRKDWALWSIRRLPAASLSLKWERR